jgi:hypothetical protein
MSGYNVNGTPLMMHWGIGGTNFCKNMEYIDCLLSRFDAHCGLYHGKIENSTINGLEVVGHGTLTLENSRLFGRYGGKTAGAGNSLIYLRGDYASTWDGEIKLKDFTAYERITEDAGAFVFYHSYNNWNFGYLFDAQGNVPALEEIVGNVKDSALNGKNFGGVTLSLALLF